MPVLFDILRTLLRQVPSPPRSGEKVADRPDEGLFSMAKCEKRPLTLLSPPIRCLDRALGLQNVLAVFELFMTGVAIVEHRGIRGCRSFEILLARGLVQFRTICL